jgi:hypothetical protein
MPRTPAGSAILLTYRRAVIRYEYKYEAGECGCLSMYLQPRRETYAAVANIT